MLRMRSYKLMNHRLHTRTHVRMFWNLLYIVACFCMQARACENFVFTCKQEREKEEKMSYDDDYECTVTHSMKTQMLENRIKST